MRPSGTRFWGALTVALVVALPAATALAQSSAVQQLLADADAALEADDFEKAARNYDRAIAQEPRGIKPEVYAKRATIFFRNRKYQEGLDWIARVADKAYPGDPRIDEQRAILMFAIPARKGDAIQLAEKVVAASPGAHALHYVIGEYYFSAGAGRAKQAAAAYESYLKTRPGDAARETDKKVKVKLGISYLHLGQYQLAEKNFEEAQRSPGDSRYDANARKGLCATYTMAGQQGDRASWSRAVTMCERVIAEKAALRGDASPYFNLGQAYLHNKQWAKALDVANLYIGAKPKEAKGYLLRGQVFFGQQKWNEAEAQFLQADRLAPKSTEVARWLGRVYLSQRPPQTKKAIERLTIALTGNPNDADTYRFLAEAYLADGQAGTAASTAEKALQLEGQEQNVALMNVAAGAYYKANDLTNALKWFKAAGEVDPKNDVSRSGRVNILVKMAAVAFKAGDLDRAESLVSQALVLDGKSSIANFDMGLLKLRQGKYQEAIDHLQRKQPVDLIGNRLIGKAYLNLGDTAKASEHYARAAAEAEKLRNRPMLAEIYTEYAPLLLAAGDIEGAVEKLELAAQASTGRSWDKATRRNLQLAYFQRGYKRLRAREIQGAVADLEGASREPALLRGSEEDVFTFGLGLAYLAAGQEAKATAIFEKYAKKPGARAWLKPPYDTIGVELFLAYALYREGSTPARSRAAEAFEKLAPKATGALGGRVRELLRSSWEFIAYDHYGRGATKPAEAALAKAEAYATGDKRLIEHNRAVLGFGGRAGKDLFAGYGEKPVEALVNLGILYDREGDAKKAYELWVQAKGRGAKAPKLDEWIEAKKRIFNF